MQPAYGTGGRIGFINPTAIWDVMSKELELVMPPSCMVLVSSLSIRNLVPDEFKRARTLYKNAVLDLVDCEVDVIVAAGNPVMTLEGTDGDEQLIAELSRHANVPITTLLTAEREAVQSIGAANIVLASPFVNQINDARVEYFAAHGINVIAHEGVGITHNVDITKLSADIPYQMMKRLLERHPEADAAVITCPRWPVVAVAEKLSKESRKPVVTAVRAMVWKALDLINSPPSVSPYGAELQNSDR